MCAIAIIRFFRVCISLHDVFYNNYIIRHNLFDYIMKVWRQNSEKYNLINSAIIHLFDFIHRENVRRLVKHVVTSYREDFEKVDYVETFQSLISLQKENEASLDVQESKVVAEFKSDQDETYFDVSDEGEEEESKNNATPEVVGVSSSLGDVADEEAYFQSLAHGKKREEDEDEEDAFMETMTEEEKKTGSPSIKIQIKGGSSPLKRPHQPTTDHGSEHESDLPPAEKKPRLSDDSLTTIENKG